jgi:glycosyltransferase involved in cell wall biosynthesis
VKVGFISVVDPADPGGLSGMPYAMRRALAASGCEVATFVPERFRYRWHHAARFRIRRLVPEPLRRALKRRPPNAEAGVEPPGVGDEQIRAQVLDDVSRQSREIRELVRERSLDLLFGCCISVLLYELDVEIPVVYFSDTTSRLIRETYPRYREMPEGRRRAWDDVEQRAMQRAAAVVLATGLARRSAIEDYGVAPERAFVVPMGANVVGEAGGAAAPDPAPPSRSSLELVICASDPVRKRLDLAIDVVDALRRRGWSARLEVVGPPTARARAHPHVHCLGYLDLRAASDRRRNYEALARSHLMILPSVGEAFGIAPCEAALAGRPSIVSAAGGLPEVVRHGETGIVMGLEAGPEDYAGAIAELAGDPKRYRAMAARAYARARAEFTWERWGERLVDIMQRVRRRT